MLTEKQRDQIDQLKPASWQKTKAVSVDSVTQHIKTLCANQ
jgi:hypothetical protein